MATATETAMEPSNKLLSDITTFRTYAKYLPHVTRREIFPETVNRNMHMHLDRFPKLSNEIARAFTYVHECKAMPSMRSLQFAGEAVLKNHIRQYNCSFRVINDVRAFGEVLFLLLSGAGVGFSVQKRHTSLLPMAVPPSEEGRFIVHDSIQGWAQSVDALMEAYFFGRIRPVFDFTAIRAKGTRLVTSGAKAPGPEPLKAMLVQLESKLKASVGRKLRPIEIHDIVCMISDCVLAGGIRRAALISLFDRDDKEMLTCKSGNWHEKYPWRARANNSAVMHRDEVTKEEFMEIYKACRESGAGEPGFSWTRDYDAGFNPCHEVSLNNMQMCNLTTVNVTGITSEKEFLKRVQAVALIGTIQAAYTDFPYLTPGWKAQTEAEALLGVSMTGVADNMSLLTPELLEKGAKLVLETNERIAKKIGINPCARGTVLKPEGSSSCVLGSASGIHDRHAPFYLRRIRIDKNDALARYLGKVIPGLVEDDIYSRTGVVVTIPQKSPKGALVRNNGSALGLFERASMFNKHWIQPGHRSGVNLNNVSCTISVKENEWDALGDAMWNQRESYTGISLLPYDGGSYQQAPFEECDEATFERLNSVVQVIDLRDVMEVDDNTERMEQLSCVGGVCELTL